MRRYFTNSELGTYLDCPRRWYLAYVLKLLPTRERYKPPRVIGNVVHNALALYYDAGTDPREVVLVERARLLARYEAITAENPLDEEVIADINGDMDMAHAIVEGYLVWLEETGADQDLEFLDSEKEVSASILDYLDDWYGYEDVLLLGKLDSRTQRRSDGARLFVDHKTVGDLVQLPRWAHLNTQFLHYHTIERMTSDTRTDGGIFNMMRRVKRTARAKPPFYERYPVMHNVQQLRSYFVRTVALVSRLLRYETELRDGADHKVVCPPAPSQECAWKCEFFALCPMMDDGSDWEGLMLDAYREGNPLERYVQLEKG